MRLLRRLAILLFILQAAATDAAIKVAVTVDDLPRHGKLPPGITRLDITKKMLKAFTDHKVAEVYGFINAEKLDDDPKLAEDLNAWVAAGFPLANHTFAHKSINDISIEEYKQSIDRNEEALKKFGSAHDWHYFRYPFLREGNTKEKREAIRGYLKEKSYKIAQVTIDQEDWSWNDPYARCVEKKNGEAIAWLKKTFLDNALDQLKRADKSTRQVFGRPVAHILLLHVGAFDAEMMSELLALYKKNGVEFIPLSEAVKDKVYASDSGIVAENGSEFQYQIMKQKGLTLKDMGLETYTGYPEERLKTICL